MIIFFLDTNILIQEWNKDFLNESEGGAFTDDFLFAVDEKYIAIPEDVFDEVKRYQGNQGLLNTILGFKDKVFRQRVLGVQYWPQIIRAYGFTTIIDMERVGADPYLIANAMSENGKVVTSEKSRPSKTRPANKKIPDICKILNVLCSNYEKFTWELHEAIKLESV